MGAHTGLMFLLLFWDTGMTYFSNQNLKWLTNIFKGHILKGDLVPVQPVPEKIAGPLLRSSTRMWPEGAPASTKLVNWPRQLMSSDPLGWNLTTTLFVSPTNRPPPWERILICENIFPRIIIWSQTIIWQSVASGCDNSQPEAQLWHLDSGHLDESWK